MAKAGTPASFPAKTGYPNTCHTKVTHKYVTRK